MIVVPPQALLIPLTKATTLETNVVAYSVVYGVSTVSDHPPIEIPKGYPLAAD